MDRQLRLDCPNNSKGEHAYEWSPHCGVRVCNCCGDHAGLERCYCGWRRFEIDVNYDVIED